MACIAPAAAAPVLTPTLTFQPVDPSTTSLPPQVFVRDNGAAAQTDDRGIVSIAGFRRLRTADQPAVELYNGDGTSLLFTLEKWRAAAGSVDLSSDDQETKAVITLHRLIAFGRYSLFLRTGFEDGVRYTPLDGKGSLNSFSADQTGTATVTLYTPKPLTTGAVIVAVYHSDAQDHGLSPGAFGRTAHQQLIVRVP